MSRRANLLILALFLVLLAIPAAYVALTWNPKNPLQFHLEHMAPLSADERVEDDREIEIRITNSSPTPIAFRIGYLLDPSGSAVHEGNIIPDQAIVIPAYGDALVLGTIPPHLVDAAQEGKILAYYFCQSRTKTLASEALFWVMQRSPGWAKRHFLFPEVQQGTATLEAPKNDTHTTTSAQ